jgi:acetyl esterase
MPLDVQTRAFLGNLAAAAGPALCELPVETAREALKQLSASADIRPPEVAVVENRILQGPGGEIPIRVYQPADARDGAGLPMLLLYHGGGFALGDLDSHDTMARYYCAYAGAMVLSVHYRRSPEHKFPAAVEDCYAALEWAARQGAGIGGDPARIAVTGDSAGGNLSAAVCLAARDRRGPRVAFQALVYPATDFSAEADYLSRREFGGGEYLLSQQDIRWLSGMYFTDQGREGRDALASPLLAEDLSGLPPALIITAGFDPLRDEGRLYAERLAAAGVAAEYCCFEDTIHGFLSFAGAITAGREGLQLVSDRVARALHDPKPEHMPGVPSSPERRRNQ